MKKKKHLKSILAVLIMGMMSSANLLADCVYEQVVEGENLQIGTMLTWSTSFEDENSVFIVEKSIDGATFEEIGNVPAAGTSDVIKAYNYLDIMAKTNRNFYRLKQVDKDGSFSYSDIVTVAKKFENNFMVARMSAIATTDVFNLTLDSFEEGMMTYSLKSIKGELILEEDILMVSGLNELTLDLADQKAGIYKLSLSMENETEMVTLRKVEDEMQKKPNVASTRKLTGNK